jgi:hypothetical protein
MKRCILLLTALVLAGCTEKADGTLTTAKKEDTAQVNQCMKAELFYKCLNTVPAGPSATKYNDWDEVVQQCEYAASHMSYRKYSTIPEECRVD